MGHAQWDTFPNYLAEEIAYPLRVVYVTASWVGSRADFVDTAQIPKVSAVRIHEGECMDRLAVVCLEMMKGGISCMVPDSYCMLTAGSVAVDFLWMRTVSCSLGGRSGGQPIFQTHPVEHWFVSGSLEKLRGETGQVVRPTVNVVMCREGNVLEIADVSE